MSKKSSTFAPAFEKRVIFNKAPVRESMRKFTFEIEEEEAQPLHELHRNEVMDCRFRRGAVVQLVRIPACHAVGREFESRPHREKRALGLFFCALFCSLCKVPVTWSRDGLVLNITLPAPDVR